VFSLHNDLDDELFEAAMELETVCEVETGLFHLLSLGISDAKLPKLLDLNVESLETGNQFSV
jgi:hypothetical protein